MDSFNTDRKMSGITREEEIDYLEKVKFARYDKLSEIMKEFRIHGFNATIKMGQTTIKSALLINAGAVIAFLTIFTNNIKYFFNMNAEYAMIGQGVLDAVHYWGMGTLMACLAYGVSYLSQSFWLDCLESHSSQLFDSFWKAEAYQLLGSDKAKWCAYFCIGLVVGSFALFFAGMQIAYDTFFALFVNAGT